MEGVLSIPTHALHNKFWIKNNKFFNASLRQQNGFGPAFVHIMLSFFGQQKALPILTLASELDR